MKSNTVMYLLKSFAVPYRSCPLQILTKKDSKIILTNKLLRFFFIFYLYKTHY